MGILWPFIWNYFEESWTTLWIFLHLCDFLQNFRKIIGPWDPNILKPLSRDYLGNIFFTFWWPKSALLRNSTKFQGYPGPRSHTYSESTQWGQSRENIFKSLGHNSNFSHYPETRGHCQKCWPIDAESIGTDILGMKLVVWPQLRFK